MLVAAVTIAVAILGARYLTWFKVWVMAPLHLAGAALTCATALCLVLEWLVRLRRLKLEAKRIGAAVLGPAENAVFCGESIGRERVYIKPSQRTMHTQVIGTTNAGKTESVILPWAIQDIQQGRGLILIDGKADRSLLEKLWAYTVQANRQADFRLFHWLVQLSHINSIR